MPNIDKPLPELRNYQGINPKPVDFDAFWERALAEMQAVDPRVELRPAEFSTPFAECFHLFFTGVGGSRIHAKYLEPVRKELVFEAGHFTCSPFFRTSPNNYAFCLLCLLSAQKNHIFERELAQLDFFLRFLDVFSAESGRLG